MSEKISQATEPLGAAPGGELVVYEAPDGDVALEVRLERETVWLTQRQMADVFRTSSDNVGLHLKNVFADGELDRAATTEDFSVVRSEGDRRVRRVLTHYNLDAIISVGYRVSSKRAVRFRQWAIRTLREHLVSGYTLNWTTPSGRSSRGPWPRRGSATSSRRLAWRSRTSRSCPRSSWPKSRA